jgi:hypothetical protein
MMNASGRPRGQKQHQQEVSVMPQVRTLLASLTLLLAAASASAANIVANGDFETGDLSNWTPSTASPTQLVDVDWNILSATPHTGYVYFDGTNTGLGTLSQSLSTIAGARYTVEFDLQRIAQDPGALENQAKVWFGGTLLMDQSNVNEDWHHYTFTDVGASAASTVLQFGLHSYYDYTELDNVSVIMTAVPEPSAALMLAAGLILIVRRRAQRPPPF